MKKFPKFKAAKKPGVMNQTEQWYYDTVLMPKVKSGEYVKVRYEALKIILGKNSTYLPDFYVLRSDGCVEIHETKGFWREDDRVKIKASASLFPEFYWYGIRISGKKIKKIEEF